MKRIVIVEDDKELINKYTEYFKNDNSIQIVGIFNDGRNAIDYIELNREFDLMILDLVLPCADGFEVLDYLRKNNIKKKVIVTSAFKSNEVIRKAQEYNIDYFLLKPFELNSLKNKIDGFGSHDINIKISLKDKLHNLGMSSSLLGYFYVSEAILMVYNDQKYIKNITKLLYPEISIKYNTTSQRVERLIRNAIEVSWLRGNMEAMDELFGNSVDINKGKPTNSEFIITLAELLKLENNSNNW